MYSFLKDKSILVTGGAGFLGKHLVKHLQNHNVSSISIPRSAEYDLRRRSHAQKAVQNHDIVIHLAANVGGIGYNKDFPADLYYDNILMGTHMMEEARKAGAKKFVSIGTICAYPKHTPVPFKERDLWAGYPEETNAPYGLAKKMQLIQAQAYRQQYGFNAIYLLPVNLYGPGDNFDPESSHVIPALIRKFTEAKEKNESSVIVWGTGKASREFLYVEDAAEAIALAAEHYNESEPVNVGAGFEISIKELAELIKELTGFEGSIQWDTSKPDGQPRRSVDTRRAKESFGFKAKTKFKEGLKYTIDWFKKYKTQL